MQRIVVRRKEQCEKPVALVFVMGAKRSSNSYDIHAILIKCMLRSPKTLSLAAVLQVHKVLNYEINEPLGPYIAPHCANACFCLRLDSEIVRAEH